MDEEKLNEMEAYYNVHGVVKAGDIGRLIAEVRRQGREIDAYRKQGVTLDPHGTPEPGIVLDKRMGQEV